MPETTNTEMDSVATHSSGRCAAYAAEMHAAKDAAQALAAAWAADPAAAAAVVRHQAAQRLADEPAPDSCAVLENTKRSYAAYGDRHAADPEAVRRFEAAAQTYADALNRLEATI